MRRKFTVRDMAIIGLILISLSSTVGTYTSYVRAHSALTAANAALGHARALRKLTDYKLCRAIRQAQEINNHDRDTILRGIRQQHQGVVATRKFVKSLTSPDGKKLGAFLLALIDGGADSNRKNLSDRPHITPLRCVGVIEHPTGKLPVIPTTTTTDTSTTTQ
jgi:type II secretory pathway pseudopilin PulG